MTLDKLLDRGREIRLMLQEPEGYAYSGNVLATNLSLNPYPESVRRIGDPYHRDTFMGYHWTLELTGVGELTMTPGLAKEYERIFTAIEWRCEWCGSVQPAPRLSCKQCGGSRSFLYELMQFAHKEW